MAIDIQDINDTLAALRVSGTNCQEVGDLARQLEAITQAFEQVFQEFATEIINIINNGGGGATTPVFIIRALVNQVGGVPASQATFPFDGGVDLFTFSGLPSGVTSGTAINPGRGFQDNEPVRLVSFNGTTWLADKITDNTIYARVNKLGDVVTTDVTFPFDGAVSIGTAPAPAGGTGVAINVTGNAYTDNELLVMKLVENPDVLVAADLDPNSQAWVVVQDDDDLGGGGGGTSYSADLGIDPAKLSSGKIAIYSNDYEAVDEVTSQVYGHIGGEFLFRGMASFAIATLSENITSATTEFSVSNYTRLCGIFPTGLVVNSIGVDLPAGAKALIGRKWDEDEWHLLASIPVTRISRGVVTTAVPRSFSLSDPSVSGRVQPTILAAGPIRYIGDPQFAAPLRAVNGAGISMEVDAPVVGNILNLGNEFVFEVLLTDLTGLPGRNAGVNQSIGSDGGGADAGKVMWQDDGACP